MPLNQETFAQVANRFEIWFRNASAGGTRITNMRLDYINQAQNWLQEHYPWDMLWASDLELTLSGRTASLPSDFYRVVAIGADYDNDGRIDEFYYRYGRPSNGFQIHDAFDGTTGHAWTITFYQTLEYTPVLRYQKVLSDFADDGSTEYTFFSGNLLLKTAQMLAVEDGNDRGREYEKILAAQAKVLRDYKQATVFVNNELRREIINERGQIIEIPTTWLDGSDSSSPSRQYNNSQDLGR